MNDGQYLIHAFKGEKAAIAFFIDIIKVAHIWDDLIDQDKEVSARDIDDAFWRALIAIPCNPFFQRFQGELSPLMQSGILNWQLANKLQADSQQGREIAHVLRYSIIDMGTYICALIGGPDWANEVAPELRLRCQRDTLENFLKEIG